MEEELKLFNDLPLFERAAEGKPDDSEEQFGHEAYASTLFEMLKANKNPLTVGFFGEWGTGKTTVINILLKNIRSHDPDGICPVLFNAWRHSGDSFRRQLLIAVGKMVYKNEPDEYERLTDLTGVTTPRTMMVESADDKEVSWRGFLEEIKVFGKWLFSPKIAARLTLVAIVAWIILTGVGVFMAVRWDSPGMNFLLTALFVPVILVFFSVTKIGAKHKLVALFNISQPAGEQPRLSYPEHFEREFDKCLDIVAHQGRSLLVIVDDLDRCDDKTVIDALSVIKQFAGTGKKNCAFIIPCDEAQVLKAVNEGEAAHDYQYESLRKFFDVAVRMDTIPEVDLHNYAKYLINRWKLPPRIAEIAVYSGARDARKVKSFLNAFRARYWVIKEREPEYFDEGTAKGNMELIAKLTALQEGFPDFYKQVRTDPSIISKIEESLRMSPANESQKKLIAEMKKYMKDDKTLERFLRYTSDIDLTKIGELVVGKRPEQIATITTGSLILAALAEGKVEEFVEAVKGLNKVECRSLIDYINLRIKDFREQNLSVSLRIYVQCILEIFSDKTVWADESRREGKQLLADIIVDTVSKSKKELIKEIGNLIAIESVLEIASEPHKLANSVIQTYLKEPAASDRASYLSLFNRGSKHFGENLKKVNIAIKKALQGEQESQILKQLIDPEVKIDNTDPIPSDMIVNQIVEGLQPDEGAYEINEQRIQIIRAYPDRVALLAFLKKWIQLTESAQGSTVKIEGTNFGLWLGILNEIGKFEKEQHAELILQPVISIWTHNGDEKIRQDLLTTFALIYPALSEVGKEEVKSNIVKWLNTRPRSEIKEYLEYLTKDRKPGSKQTSLYVLAVHILESFVEWVKGQVNAYNERVDEITSLVVEHHSILEDKTKLTELVDHIVKNTNDQFFEKWHVKSLGSLCDCLSEETQQNLGQTVFERIEDPPTTKARRNLLLDLLITKLSPKGLGGTETDRIFKLLWNDDSNIREPICEKFKSLKSKFKLMDFRRNISIMARDISNSSDEKITQKVNAVSAFLKNLEDLSEQDTKMVLSIVPSLIRSTNSTESIGVGLEMLDTLANKNNVSQDILSGLEALLEHSDENLKKRSDLFLEKFQAKGRFSKREKDIDEEGADKVG